MPLNKLFNLKFYFKIIKTKLGLIVRLKLGSNSYDNSNLILQDGQ